MEPGAKKAWQKTTGLIRTVACRTARVHVFRKANIPPAFKECCIDVTQYGVDGKSYNFNLPNVTGANPQVQARVAAQGATARVIAQAVKQIEQDALSDPCVVAFACDGGTHRSFACACLLASLVLPEAAIIPSTQRTINDSVNLLISLR